MPNAYEMATEAGFKITKDRTIDRCQWVFLTNIIVSNRVLE